VKTFIHSLLILLLAPLLLSVLCAQDNVDDPGEDLADEADEEIVEPVDPVEPEEATAQEPLLPKVPPVGRYESIWKNSPFELEAAPDVAVTAKVSFAKDYALSGMLKQGDETIVYIINRKTRETHKVTREGAGDSGFKLRSIQGGSSNVREIEATIEKDGEVARLTYDKTLMAAAASARTNKAVPGRQAVDPQGRVAEAMARAKARQGGDGNGAPPTTSGNRATPGAGTARATTDRDSKSVGGNGPSPTTRRRIVLPKPVAK